MQKISGRELPFADVKAKMAMQYAAVTGLSLSHQHLVASS